MKKVILVSLIVALVSALVLPAVYTPAPVMAGSSISCTPGELSFRVYQGVPTTLLGFIPLETQTVTVNSNGGWTAKDDAGWLSLFPCLAFSGGDLSVWVNGDLDVGTYTATITITPFFSSNSVTVPVTVEVIEPKVMGPLGIGMLNILDTSTENYGGFVVNLLTNPDDAMDMQAIETDGFWNMVLQRGEEFPDLGYTLLNGGTLTINGEAKEIVPGGAIAPISMLMSMMGGALPIPADFDWGENYAVLFDTTDGESYIGILLADIGKLLDLLPMLGDMLSGGEESAGGTALPAPSGKSSDSGTPSGPIINEPSPEMVIPLKPILNLLPALMPVMMDLLSNETVLAILEPLMGLLPPIMIFMPLDVMVDLFFGLM